MRMLDLPYGRYDMLSVACCPGTCLCPDHAWAPPPPAPFANPNSDSAVKHSPSPGPHPSARRTKEAPTEPRVANAKNKDPDIPPTLAAGSSPPRVAAAPQATLPATDATAPAAPPPSAETPQSHC